MTYGKNMQKLFKNKGIILLPWQRHSSHLNLIENWWRLLKVVVQKSVHQIKRSLLKVQCVLVILYVEE